VISVQLFECDMLNIWIGNSCGVAAHH